MNFGVTKVALKEDNNHTKDDSLLFAGACSQLTFSPLISKESKRQLDI
jgi:hypothetical protein